MEMTARLSKVLSSLLSFQPSVVNDASTEYCSYETFTLLFSVKTSSLTANVDDFVAKAGYVIFGPGEKGPKSFEIYTKEDSLREPTETFSVSLVSSSLTAVKLGEAARVDIVDDDVSYVEFDEIKEIKEGDKEVLVAVKIKGARLSSPIAVEVSTIPDGSAGAGDFVPSRQNITFEPGETGPKPWLIKIVDDEVIEPKEYFFISFSSVPSFVIPGEAAVMTIADDDEAVIGFTESVYNVSEGQNAIVELEFISGESDIPVNISVKTSYLTADVDDFFAKTGYIIFGPGEKGPKSFEIYTKEDSLHEPTESFSVSLFSSSLTAVKLGEAATVNLLDDDVPYVGFIGASKEVKEGDKKVVVEVQVMRAILSSPITVEVSTIPGGTADTDDFVPSRKNITFQPGETEPKPWVIEIIDDEKTEPLEYFSVFITSTPSSVRPVETLTVEITDDDEALVGFMKSVYNVSEGETAIVEVGFISGETGIPVNISYKTGPFTADVGDFVAKAGYVTFGPGEKGPISFEIDTKEDSFASGKEPTESFFVSLVFSSLPGVKLGEAARVDIVDDDEAVIGFMKSVHNVSEGETAIVEVQFISGKTDIPVNISYKTSPLTADVDDFVAKTGYVTFGPEEKEPKSFEIYTKKDSLQEPTESFLVSLISSSLPAVKLGEAARVNIVDDDVPYVAFGDNSIEAKESDKKVVVEVEIRRAILSFPITVEVSTVANLTADTDDFVSSRKNITFQPGETGPKPWVIEIIDDKKIEPVEDFRLVFTSAPSTVETGENAWVHITDDDEEACDKKTDVIFVVDRSASVRPADYDKVRSFIQALGKNLRVGVRNGERETIGQGALVTFSNEGKRIISLKESRSPGRFDKAVRFMSGPLPGGATKTHRGLKVAYEQVAVTSEGLREDDRNVHKVLVVITNEAQTREPKGFVYIGQAVQPFFSRGFSIVAVGINLPNRKAKDQLKDMARTAENAFEMRSYHDLPEYVQQITAKLCPARKICGTKSDDCHKFATCTDIGPGKHECQCFEGYYGDGKTCTAKICTHDIGFLIDSSASMRDCNYEKEKDLVNSIAQSFQVAPGKSHASVILYSDDAALHKRFDRQQSLQEFRDLVNSLPMLGGPTHMDEALELAGKGLFKTKNGMRDSTVPKLLFVLTDGAQTTASMGKPLKALATLLHHRNIQVLVIGAGEADKNQLEQLVQSPDDLIMVRRFEEATEKVTAMASRMCTANRCALMKRMVRVRTDGCMSMQPVAIGTCMGKCIAGPNFLKNNGVLKISCQHCRPGIQATKKVLLTCPGPQRKYYEVKEARSCICQKCPWKRL